MHSRTRRQGAIVCTLQVSAHSLHVAVMTYAVRMARCAIYTCLVIKLATLEEIHVNHGPAVFLHVQLHWPGV